MTEQEFVAFVGLVQRAGLNPAETAYVNRILIEIRDALVDTLPEAEAEPDEK